MNNNLIITIGREYGTQAVVKSARNSRSVLVFRFMTAS